MGMKLKKVGMGRRIHSNILMDLKQIIKCFQSSWLAKRSFSHFPAARAPAAQCARWL
jgi:hypothetical protein